MTEIQNRISIQVGLSGYSFKIEDKNGMSCSGWLGPESVFTVKELQKRYSLVEISVLTPYCTLVPQDFYNDESAREQLADVVKLPEGAVTDAVPVPEFGSVLVFSSTVGGTLHKVLSESVLLTDGNKVKPLPEMYYMLKEVLSLPEYNRILASYMDGILYLVVAQGKTLLLCNSYKAPDFTTAEYFIFMVMKKLQLNPEMSTITFRTPLTDEQEISLYRYFKSVDSI
jgi:hypothetical protein